MTAIDLPPIQLSAPDGRVAQCFGCECDVSLTNGMHEEGTDNEGMVYTYPCTATPIAEQA